MNNHLSSAPPLHVPSQTVDIPIEKIKPNASGVLQAQGIPPGKTPPPRVLELYHQAERLFLQLASPKGIMAEISAREFASVYRGNGKNEPDTPLEHIFPQANYLALFAFTLGKEISIEIERLTETKNLSLGYMLDAVASYCADKAAEAAQDMLYNRLQSSDIISKNTRVLLYSPGYCGWHVSGQKKLFQYLNPEKIGIHLNKSFLMSPLKSISGVLVAGNPDIHRFINNFPFCSHCRTHNCRQRITESK